MPFTEFVIAHGPKSRIRFHMRCPVGSSAAGRPPFPSVNVTNIPPPKSTPTPHADDDFTLRLYHLLVRPETPKFDVNMALRVVPRMSKSAITTTLVSILVVSINSIPSGQGYPTSKTSAGAVGRFTSSPNGDCASAP